MNRAERLFQLTNLLRGRRTVVTAATLAEALDVSERTIYRDIQALVLSGVPVEGEAGVGYRIRHDFELPPLLFDREEMLALLLGSRMVRAWGDRTLSGAAGRALDKINAVMPEPLKALAEQHWLLVPDLSTSPELSHRLERLRHSIESQQRVYIHYTRLDGERSERLLDPLGQAYWGGKWTLIAWCHHRQDYRQFRIDRIQQLEITDQHFEILENQSLQHYLAEYENCSVQDQGTS